MRPSIARANEQLNPRQQRENNVHHRPNHVIQTYKLLFLFFFCLNERNLSIKRKKNWTVNTQVLKSNNNTWTVNVMVSVVVSPFIGLILRSLQLFTNILLITLVLVTVVFFILMSSVRLTWLLPRLILFTNNSGRQMKLSSRKNTFCGTAAQRKS